jgi:predicted ATPase
VGGARHSRCSLELKRQEFLFERSAAGEQIYVFKHALTQEVAHDSLLTLARQTLHEATARALEAIYQDRLEEYYERIAYHYTQTTNSYKALEYLELANQKAAGKNAMQEAKTFFDQAIGSQRALIDTKQVEDQRLIFAFGRVQNRKLRGRRKLFIEIPACRSCFV